MSASKSPAFFATLECRWILSGPVPAPFDRCLTDADWASVGMERTDHYLPFPSAESVGVKLRDGALEIKVRLRGGNRQRFPGLGTGRVEWWEKWRDVEPTVFCLNQTSDAMPTRWRAVHKRRRSWAYQLGSGAPEPVAPDALAPVRCSLEIVGLEVCGQHWWSLALEAHRPDRVEPGELPPVLARFQSDQGIGDVSAMFETAGRCSVSYPAWLRRNFPAG